MDWSISVMETAPKAAQLLAAGSTETMQPAPELARRVAAIVAGEDWNPFSFLGLHQDSENGDFIVRAFIPGAERITVLSGETGNDLAELSRLHHAGLFAGPIAGRRMSLRYRLRVTSAAGTDEIDDPYAFGPTLGALDLLLYAQGNYRRSFEKLGAHPITLEGIDGTTFAVWAPNARRVSVVGDFNAWDGRRHPMRAHPGSGLWEIFLPRVGQGAVYKYEIKTQLGEVLLKADPYAFRCEPPPRTASIVHRLPTPRVVSSHVPVRNDRRAPIAIYEVHLGSWRRADASRYLTYGELADQLIPYVKDLGFTHIELLPVAEYPFDGSWGYQPTALYAPTSRFGTPDEFRAFADRCRMEGIGLILDWVVAHFPSDPHGLAHFDGTTLYEHADPREGRHPDWDTLIYNFGRNEVRNFLMSNALFWLERYDIDGLRVDAVASMLYRNYSRKEGDWIPNRYGGVDNLEAVELLRKANELIYGEHPEAMTIAEESTAWPMVSRPTHAGGLGFGYKWNLGWMHDTLDYMSKDAVHRRFHHDQLTFGLLYAFNENFILPLSHDEVVHGKGSLLAKMPGDTWQKFANLRVYLAFQYTQPGKKLLFMGAELAQEREWNHDTSLDWHLLNDPLHQGVQSLVRDLNTLYRACPALHELDCEPSGFAWISCDDRDNSVISYLRRAADPDDFVVVVCSFTPVVRHGYRIGVPTSGSYLERLNSDSLHYGGSNVGNGGMVVAEALPSNGMPFSLSLTLPPLGALVLSPRDA
jgi:1,4-alpha-glucan branching enzyme